MKFVVQQRKSLVLVSVKQAKNFAWVCIIMFITFHYLIICLLMEKKFKIDNKNVNFPAKFCLENMSNGYSATESKEVSLNRNVYEFSLDFNYINISGILNIQKYLMTTNKIKQCLSLLRSVFCITDF